MSKSQNQEEYLDKVADDRKVSVALGRNLHKVRMRAKMPDGKMVTFDWLSQMTTLHHVSIRRFEKGETGMTVGSLVRLKDALGCSWDDLLEGCSSEVVKARKPKTRK